MTTGKVLLAILLAGLVFSSPGIAQDEDAQPIGWTPELALKVKQIANVRVSPDGSRVVYEVKSAIMSEEESEFRTHIHVANVDGSESFQLTRGEASCAGVRWSPDGRWIAFLSSRDSEQRNLWRIRLAGGEAERLTDLKSSAIALAWSLDGSMIAFTMPDVKTKEGAVRLHLVAVQANEGDEHEIRVLTPGEISVVDNVSFGTPFDWSPDGATISFMHQPTPKFDDRFKSDISIVDVETGTVRALAATNAAEYTPSYSHDGRWIAFGASDDPGTWLFS